MRYDRRRITNIVKLAKQQPMLLGHRKSFGRRASDWDIVRTEKQLGVSLPDALRDFYLELGDGAPGPGAGVYRLADIERESPNCSRPFLHRTRWNGGNISEKLDRLLEREDAGEHKVKSEIDQIRETIAMNLGGVTWICHTGCNMGFGVIANGEFRGDVWYDCTGDCSGIISLRAMKYPTKNELYKLGGNGRRLGFEEWYLTWIEFLESNLQ